MSAELNHPAALAHLLLADITLSESEPQTMRRQRFDDGQLDELAESIAEHGVLQPIIVRPLGPDGLDYKTARRKYELVAGERRLLAARRAELESIPAVIRELNDEQVLEVQLIENLQRADLHPMEEAEGYQQLMKVHGHPMEELHARVGKSRSYVYGRLKLLALCDEARKAFYAGAISSSIALLLARIPHEKLQREALAEIRCDGQGWRHEMTFREARTFVQEHYMLRLKGAPFPIKDAELVPEAGPCGDCPKRTGNQPELFGDVQSADVCTDPLCFAAKTRAQGDRAIAAAKAEGREVLTGKKAKAVLPYGDASRGSITGYERLDDRNYSDPKADRGAKCRTNRQIVGPDVEVTLLQDPETGAAIELVKESVVRAALKTARGSAAPQDDGSRERARKAKIEKAFREKLYGELRPKLRERGAIFEEIAEALFDRLEHDGIKILCKIRGFEPPIASMYGRKERDHRAIGKTIKDLDGLELELFITDCIFARELLIATWSDRKPEKLLAAAKAHGVDAAAIRRLVAPKKKAGKKKAKKKTAKKRSRTK